MSLESCTWRSENSPDVQFSGPHGASAACLRNLSASKERQVAPFLLVVNLSSEPCDAMAQAASPSRSARNHAPLATPVERRSSQHNPARPAARPGEGEEPCIRAG